jgi:hypothetical protein
MVVAGDSRERAIELARRMEESQHFTQTYVETEHAAPLGSGDVVELTINGIYVPVATPAPVPAPKTVKATTEKRSKS